VDDMCVDSGFHDYLLRDVLKEHRSDERGAEPEVSNFRRGQGCMHHHYVLLGGGVVGRGLVVEP
jgi:hypothetical protein